MQVDNFLKGLGREMERKSEYRKFNLQLSFHSIEEEVKTGLVEMCTGLAHFIRQVSERQRLLEDNPKGESRGAAIPRLKAKAEMLKGVERVIYNTGSFIVRKAGLTARVATAELLAAIKALAAEWEKMQKRVGEVEEEKAKWEKS